LAVPATITAYYNIFLRIKPYDDEGTLMDVVRNFLSGRPLYDAVPCIYGPAFVFYQWAAHRLAGAQVTTDSIRFVSIAFSIGADLLVFWLVYRGTRSALVAAGAFVVAFRALTSLAEDPGHPQELCLLLVLAMGVAACYAANVSRMMWWLGGLAGALAMTKINIGALMVLAIGLVLMYAARWRMARIAAIAGSLGFVWLLMAPLLTMDWTRRYWFVAEISLVALMIALWRVRFDVRVGWREFAIAGAGFVAAVAALASFALATGSTPGAMIEWMIVKPRAAIGPGWFFELPIERRMLVWTLLGLAAALAAQTRFVRPWMTAAAKLTGAAGVVILVMWREEEYLMTAVPPFLWLLTVTEDQEARSRLSVFSRALLAAIGVLLVLYGYPVAGNAQIDLVSTFLIGVTAVGAGDGCRWLATRLGRGERWVRWLAYAAMALLLVRFSFIMPLNARTYYFENPALGVPGARRLHLEDDAAGLRNLVGVAQRNCTALLTAPGMPSFNIWTGLPRPAELGGGNWVTRLDDATQENVVREIADNPKLCVIYSKDMIAMWTHHADVSGRPIIRFIQQNFRPVGESRGNVLMLRR
jgi:hypothetical protein